MLQFFQIFFCILQLMEKRLKQIKKTFNQLNGSYEHQLRGWKYCMTLCALLLERLLNIESFSCLSFKTLNHKKHFRQFRFKKQHLEVAYWEIYKQNIFKHCSFITFKQVLRFSLYTATPKTCSVITNKTICTIKKHFAMYIFLFTYFLSCNRSIILTVS